MNDTAGLYQAVIEKLSKVIDPETGADVIRMKLVKNLEVNPGGLVSYTIRPSSPLCPVAVFLAIQIKMAVASIPGVTAQQIWVTNYIAADELTELINQEDLFDLGRGKDK